MSWFMAHPWMTFWLCVLVLSAITETIRRFLHRPAMPKAEFVKLVDAYLGARSHERWARENGTEEEYELAATATKEAHAAMMKGACR